jgi:hypothetical protein
MATSSFTSDRRPAWRVVTLAAARATAIPVTLGAVAASSGCTALVNTDKFYAVSSQPDSAVTDAGYNPLYSNLALTLSAMIPHNTHYFEYRVVDHSNLVQARGVLDPCTIGTSVNAPRAIPTTIGGPYRLDFFAETSDNNHLYDEPDAEAPLSSPLSPNIAIRDHGWRVGPPLMDWSDGPVIVHQNGTVQVNFIHNALFTDINFDLNGNFNAPLGFGNDITIDLSNLDKVQGDLLEVRIYDSGTTRNVGLYRLSSVSGSSATLTLKGVADAEVPYIIDVYVDKNHNGTYDNPATGGGDSGWRFNAMSTATGLTVKFDATMSGGNVDVGPP